MLKHIMNPENGIPEMTLSDIIIAVKKDATLNEVVLIHKTGEREFTFFPDNVLPIKIFRGGILDCMKKLHEIYYEFYIMENFYELKTILKSVKSTKEKIPIIYRFENPMSKVPNIVEDINKQMILTLTYLVNDYAGFLGMVIKISDNMYTLKGMRIDNTFRTSFVTIWTTTECSILSTISKFKTNMNDNHVVFYALKNWEEILYVLDNLLG